MAPTNEVEEKVAQVWKDLFGIQEVGVYDNFFELGGHSLLLVQMQSKLQAIFDRTLSVVQLFEYPTIHDLAKYLSQAQEVEPAFTQIEERGQKYRAALKQRRRQQRRLLPGQQQE